MVTNKRKQHEKTIIARKDKIKDDEFRVLEFQEHGLLNKRNYNLKQLRTIAKHYKIKSGGNKEQLKTRVSSFLTFSFYARKIQSCFRKYIVRSLIFCKGPALHNRSLCTNSTDFYTFDNIESISFANFISIKENDGFTYGFDIESLIQYFKNIGDYKIKYTRIPTSRSSSTTLPCPCNRYINPYNRNVFGIELHNHIRNTLVFSSLLGIDVETTSKYVSKYTPKRSTSNRNMNTNMQPSYHVNSELNGNNLTYLSMVEEHIPNLPLTSQQIHHKIVELFQKMDEFGHITNIDWFLTLSQINLIRFLRELFDIWSYRANLSRETQREIVHPSGNPFMAMQMSNLNEMNLYDLQYFALCVIENMVTKGATHEACGLGVFYVLCALTLVSRDAAQAIPWLYQSVQHQVAI